MFKTIPFFNSTHRKEYKEFLDQPFHTGMVGLIDGDKLNDTDPLFEGWYGKSMMNWTKFTKEKFMIEFFEEGTPYKIKNPDLSIQREFTFPYPTNVDEFICDCHRCGVNLHWSDFVIETNDIKNIVSVEEYKNYMEELLIKIGKGE